MTVVRTEHRKRLKGNSRKFILSKVMVTYFGTEECIGHGKKLPNKIIIFIYGNDDSYLFDGALFTLLDNSAKCNHQAVIVAPMRLREKGVTTYSGYDGSQKITPNGKLQECEKFNGNCVLIPQCVFKKVGNLDWTYRHAIGDIDYGYRVRKAGFKNYVATGYLGICESNPKLPAWARKEIPFIRRIKNLYSPLGYAEPIPFFLFEKRHIGFVTAVKHFITIHIRVLFPQLWKQ